MKIAVCSMGNTIDSPADPRFGRCAYFIIAHTDTLEYEAMPNPAAAQGQGAGIAAAQMVASKGVEAVVAGNIGPNAFQALNAGGIKIYTWAGGTVRQAIDAVKSGALQPVASPSVQAHYGMGQASNTDTNLGQGFGPGMGRGAGRGGGMGMGRGRGLGRGRGGF